MKKYFLHNGSQQDGPFSIEELKLKNITKDTEVWYEGLDDWIIAEKIDELNEIILPTSPPIKQQKTSTPPPIKKEKNNKKSSPIKIIAFIIIIGCIISVLGFIGYEFQQNSNNSSYSYSNSVNTYEEKKMTIAEIEQSNPVKFLDASGTYRENFLGNKFKVNGSIKNSATTASFKDAVVRVTYYTKTKTSLGSEDYTVWEVFPPNRTKKFELKVNNYRDVHSIALDVINAKVKY